VHTFKKVLKTGLLTIGICLAGHFFDSVPAYAQEERDRLSQQVAEQLSRYQGQRVLEIQIEGLNRIEEDAVVEKLQTETGEALDVESVSDDVRRIFDMGFFDDIAVYAQRKNAQEIGLVYSLKERPVIARLEFVGNEGIERKELEEVIQLREWAILDINQVREDLQRLRRHFEDKGFYLAQVDYQITPLTDDEVRLSFRIDDYEKVQIKKITFLNNRSFSDAQLKTVMPETREGGLFSVLSGAGSFRESAFRQDLQRLTYWYLDHGYIKFRYEEPVVTVSEDKKYVFISLYVDEGGQYDIGTIDFAGELLFSRDELAQNLALKTGERFAITKRNIDIQRLTEKYQDLGYAFVNVIPQMNIDEENQKVDISYHFEPGRPVQFGEIRVVGNVKTYDRVIRRELRVHEGELYSGSRLRISRERVERLGYFEPGQVVFNTVTRPGTEDILDLEIQVKERNTGAVTLGAGYGSHSGFFFTTQIQEINLFGRGQNLSLQGHYAPNQTQKSFNLGFTDPYAFGTNWSAGSDVFWVSEEIPRLFTHRKTGFDIRLGYPIWDDFFAYITYKLENLTIINQWDPTQSFPEDEGLLSSVVWSLVRDKRNNRFETTAGSYQSGTLETAGLGGDKQFIKWKINNRIYKRIWGDLIFRNSTEYGHIVDIGGTGVPRSERFFLGGPNNLRGFQQGMVGPQETRERPNGLALQQPQGGLVQMFSLFELEYPLIREAGLKTVTFFDVGNAFEGFPGVGDEAFNLRMNVGLGLRWFSPIGPLRFEWGFPLRPKPGENTMEFVFFIGPPF
jgi:outer membrane protein insertion porin family